MKEENAALCRALPLAPGHPLRRRILALLAEGLNGTIRVLTRQHYGGI